MYNIKITNGLIAKCEVSPNKRKAISFACEETSKMQKQFEEVSWVVTKDNKVVAMGMKWGGCYHRIHQQQIDIINSLIK